MRGDIASVQFHGWLYSLALVPFYGLAVIVPRLGTLQAALLLNVLVIPLTAAVLYLCLGELIRERGPRLLTALIFGLATIIWPHSHYLLREPMAALFLTLALWAAIRFWRHPAPAPLGAFVVALACSLLTKSVTVALAPFFGVLILIPLARAGLAAVAPGQTRLLAGDADGHSAGQKPRPALWLVATPIVLAMLAALLALRLPLLDFLVHNYREYLRLYGVQPLNFAALWVSPGWGLLMFSPALWLAVIGAPSFTRRYPAVAFATLAGSLVFVLAASPATYWWGNWSFGPRQMVCLIPLLCLPIPDGLARLRRLPGRLGAIMAALLIGVSVFFQLVGLAAPYGDYVRQVLFPAGVTGPAVAWNLRLWPIGELLRFTRPEILDWAWLSSRAPGAVQVHWAVALPLALLAAGAGAWLAWLARRRDPDRVFPAITALLLLAWFPVATLAVRTAYADARYQPELGFAAAAEVVRAAQRPGDLLVTDLWTNDLTGPVVAMVNYCRGQCPPRLDLIRENLTDREKAWEQARLADLAGYRRAWLVLERVAEGDQNSIVEKWLGQVGYLERCDWTGPQVRLCRYSLAAGAPLKDAFNIAFGDEIELQQTIVRLSPANGQAFSSPSGPSPSVAPGDALQLDLNWWPRRAPAADYVFSLQLLGPDGRLVTAIDRRPLSGFRPTTTWVPGRPVADRRSITVPPDAAPGAYRLIGLLYDPQTNTRLPARVAGGAGAPPVPDAAPLLEFTIAPHSP